MPKLKQLTRSDLDRAILFDVEMREQDTVPALCGVFLDGKFETVVLEELLRPAADYSRVRFCNAFDFFRALVNQSKSEERWLIAYSNHEKDVLQSMFPDLDKIIEEWYCNANMRKWFRRRFPDDYETAVAAAEGRVGLKDLLKLPVVNYPHARSVGIGSPAKAIREARDHLQRKGPSVDSLTSGVKRRWTKMLTYNEHDVRGLHHLLRFMLDYHSWA